MSAPVRIEARAWSDIRFATLARLLGLADSDHALIKVARLWSWQTEHYTAEQPTYVLDADTIESVLGEGGPAALVRAKLATEVPGGYRLHGTEGQIEWCEPLSSMRQHGGKVRAAGARRDARGRMLPRESCEQEYEPLAGHPANLQLPSSSSPAHSSAPAPSPSPEDQRSLPPARDPAVPQPEPAPVPAVSPPAPAREDIVGTQATPKYTREPSPESLASAATCDRYVGHTTINTPENIRAAGEPTLDQLWSELELARQRAAEHHRVTLGPLLAHDARRHDLANLLAEAARVGQRPRLVGQIRHAIAVAESEAIADRDQLQWLSGAVFSERNFGRLVAAPAPKKRADPRPARPRNHDPPPIPRDQLAGPEQFAEARALLAAATSNDAPPTEKPRSRKAVT